MSDQVKLDLGNLFPQQANIRRLLAEGKKRVAFVGSLQVGKSWLLARILVEQCLTNDNPYSNLIVCVSPTYKMSRVMQREIEKVLQSAPRLWKAVSRRLDSPTTYTFPNGKILELHSMENPDTLRGIRPAFIGGDEGAMFSEMGYDILEGRTIQTNCPILITTTPRGKRHWLYRRIFVPASGPETPYHNPALYDPERFGIQVATIYDNPFIDAKNRDAIITSYGGAGSLWAKQELFGEFVDYKGLVLTAFNEDTCVVPANRVPTPEQLGFMAAGQDWGFTDPSVILTGGVKDGVWWITDEFYESGVDIDELGAEMQAMKQTWNLKRFWADSAEPARISHYRKSGLPVFPVKKPRIVARLHYMNSLLHQGRLMVSSKCVNLIREMQTLSWPENVTDKKDESVKPIGPDHALDALAYLLESEKTLLNATSPVYGDEHHLLGEWSPRRKPISTQPGTTHSAGYWD